jgi:hypothetical protein
VTNHPGLVRSAGADVAPGARWVASRGRYFFSAGSGATEVRRAARTIAWHRPHDNRLPSQLEVRRVLFNYPNRPSVGAQVLGDVPTEDDLRRSR